jgi:voltage-gated potassium channel
VSAEAGSQIPEKDVSLDLAQSEENNPRLDRWINRTTLPLDLLALFTIWLTVVPLGGIHDERHPFFWYAGRILVSVIYAIDMIVRTVLARKKLHYFFHHPVGVLAVLLPVIRLIFSIRLLKAMFKKGNIAHFLFVSVVLLLNLMVIVWGFERHSSQANITSIGIAVWWGCVTVFTVGYGDYYPVTNAGRIAAVAIMVVGLTTAAVITAQIASSFMDQAQARRISAAELGAPSVTAVDGDPSTDERLGRIEDMLRTHFEATDSSSD